ncbi:DUF2092 domain-containing protein [Sulfurovum sp.]|uniref:DUF2092 domain-containing protein n=1 Tax=Sulfurovum sp. TaxID=1969726 RepID=UPI00356658AB
MKLYTKLTFATVALLLSTTLLFATEQSPRDVLNKAYDYIGSMDKYAFKAVVIDNITTEDGTVGTLRHDATVKVDRPGKLRVDVKGDTRDRSNYLNNGVYTMMDHGFGYYGQIKIPETIDEGLDYIFEKYGIRAPLAQLIYSNTHKRVKFIKSKHFGTMMVDGIECHYIAFSNVLRDVHVWISKGDKPLVKNYSIIDRTGGFEHRIDTSLYWDVNAKISDSDFIFTAPKGAEKISVQSAN